ncbi:hypothetical protein T440DRAFT_272137 [Plenodomus tracheiphilus IPT5]|uniref:Uncharacterized protein n=1 Tax=Plenodomus tracheiphilus IPT5 TaxID=1408161 RepID=A0A6A7BGB8_9PLEO|nr:hypothetical protein T440DRAFT_272137 [Plenodomus tracheiphilus IPT5]
MRATKAVRYCSVIPWIKSLRKLHAVQGIRWLLDMVCLLAASPKAEVARPSTTLPTPSPARTTTTSTSLAAKRKALKLQLRIRHLQQLTASRNTCTGRHEAFELMRSMKQTRKTSTSALHSRIDRKRFEAYPLSSAASSARSLHARCYRHAKPRDRNAQDRTHREKLAIHSSPPSSKSSKVPASATLAAFMRAYNNRLLLHSYWQSTQRGSGGLNTAIDQARTLHSTPNDLRHDQADVRDAKSRSCAAL